MRYQTVASFRALFVAILFAASLLQAGGSLAGQAGALPHYVIEKFGHPPAIPNGPVDAEVKAALQVAFIDSVAQQSWGEDQTNALRVVAASQDPRVAWIIADLMRFTWRYHFDSELANAAAGLLGITLKTPERWGEVTNHLIAWDVPAYPGYLADKRALFTNMLPGLDRVFAEGDIDWRLVSWGGVLIDARPSGATDEPCNCIPAADNPPVTSAADATWLKDEDVVFGITVNGESRAYPRRIMEVREMVNDTLGGRDLGIPYCTLCGSAQAYFTDRMPAGTERPVLRTSGLLIRSNKVMYDINTHSVFDTFLGKAVTGPLAEQGIVLQQAAVVTTDWGAWKKAHPDTTVLVEELALGRDPDFRNTRDADGPIFPVGDVDPRLPVHEDVVGIVTESGGPVAFQRSKALLALRAGSEVAFGNVKLVLDAGGLRAVDADGSALGSHEAFWFAWSQFHPDTALWPE